jgi:hypothetical protein
VRGRRLAEPAQAAFGPTELGGREGLDEVPGNCRPHRPAAHAEEVHAGFLDPLPGREMAVAQRGAEAADRSGRIKAKWPFDDGR